MSNSKEPGKQLSKKFYLGVFMILLSLVIGKITQATFIVYFNNVLIRRISIIIYLISWPMFLWGIWAVGREYGEKLQRYFKISYYRDLFTGLFARNSSEPVEEKVIERNE
jgi:hypothetical protein